MSWGTLSIPIRPLVLFASVFYLCLWSYWVGRESEHGGYLAHVAFGSPLAIIAFVTVVMFL